METLFGALYTWIMDRPTTVSRIEVEMKPAKANQYQSHIHASPRKDAHVHTKCTAVTVPSKTNLRLTLLYTYAQGVQQREDEEDRN